MDDNKRYQSLEHAVRLRKGNNCTFVEYDDGRCYMSSKADEFKEDINARFLSCSEEDYVNPTYIEAYFGSSEPSLILKDGTTVNIDKRYLNSVQSFLEANEG